MPSAPSPPCGACLSVAYPSSPAGAVVTAKPSVPLRPLLAALLLALSACGTTPAPGIKGKWQPVNRFADMPQELPLQQAYVYYAAPLDGTLKSMLERWARDSRMKLAYRHPSDFTLHAPVAQLRSGSLQDAAAELSRLYAAQGISISVQGDEIVVARTGS